MGILQSAMEIPISIHPARQTADVSLRRSSVLRSALQDQVLVFGERWKVSNLLSKWPNL